MLTIFEDSAGLRQTLTALQGEAKAGLRVRRHPWVGPLRMLTIYARTVAGAAAVAELRQRFPTCTWSQGRWHIARVQLRLFREMRA